MSDSDLAKTKQYSLTQTQKDFLGEFSKTGSTESALDTLGISMQHLYAWQRGNPKFDIEYRKIRKFYTDHLRESMALMAIHTMHEAFANGKIVTRSQTFVVERDDAGNVISTKQTTKIDEKPIPAHFYDFVLPKNSLSTAIQTLSNEGLLTNTQRNQLTGLLDEIEIKAAKIFSENKDENKAVSQDQIVAMVKMAVLGALESQPTIDCDSKGDE